MAATFKFELVSPERILMSSDAEQVLLPGIDGDMTVYSGHMPVVTTLRPGVLDIVLTASKSRVFVKSGFAEITADRVTVLADKAYNLGELDSETIANELDVAESELASAADDESRHLAHEAISALNRIKAH